VRPQGLGLFLASYWLLRLAIGQSLATTCRWSVTGRSLLLASYWALLAISHLSIRVVRVRQVAVVHFNLVCFQFDYLRQFDSTKPVESSCD
jgi:hypothetical protein